MSQSMLEETLALQVKAYELPEPIRQYSLPEIPERKWAFDFYWPSARLLVEVNGATWVGNSGHTSGKGIERDTEKACMAVVHGYRVMSVTGFQVRSGDAIAWIHAVLSQSKGA